MEPHHSQNPNHHQQPTGIPSPPAKPNLISTQIQTLKQNLKFKKSKWSELNGAMGDLGTYIPIILALTLAKNLDLGTTLIFTGAYNFLTGAIYGVPMPVQPMKSIAAVAISNPNFDIPEVMAAGICTGAILVLLGVTGLMKLAYKLVPLSVVRGIQLAQGLNFAMTAVKYVRNKQDFARSKSRGHRGWVGLDGLILALICACFIIIVNGAGDDNNNNDCGNDVNNNNNNDSDLEKRGNGNGNGNGDGVSSNAKSGWGLRRIVYSLPSAFIVFILGVVLAIIRGPGAVKRFEFGPSPMRVVRISRHAWKEGFIKGTIPQLPLSILNSVIAVCKMSNDLFPQKEVTATSVSITVGMMNLVGCWFGAMPCCHGAGGLAGQYKFGGRSGACVALLGVAKFVLGLVLGGSLVRILDQFPVGVLGVLLLFAGIELAMCARDMNSKEEAFVMLVCTAVSLVGSSAALGFLCGMVLHLLLRVRKVRYGQSWSSFWFHDSV